MPFKVKNIASWRTNGFLFKNWYWWLRKADRRKRVVKIALVDDNTDFLCSCAKGAIIRSLMAKCFVRGQTFLTRRFLFLIWKKDFITISVSGHKCLKMNGGSCKRSEATAFEQPIWFTTLISLLCRRRIWDTSFLYPRISWKKLDAALEGIFNWLWKTEKYYFVKQFPFERIEYKRSIYVYKNNKMPSLY